MIAAKEIPNAEPFFIVGCSRSGTTLLQVLLDAHPNLALPPESHIYDRFGPFLHIYGDLAVPSHRARFIASLLNDSFIREWRIYATVEEVERALKRPGRVGVIDGTRQSAWHSSLRLGISRDKIGVYRRKFSSPEIELFESVAGETLVTYGYSPEYARPRAATFLQRTYTSFADRFVRWARKVLHPSVVILELQFRARALQGALISRLAAGRQLIGRMRLGDHP
jgi:hypothetical protein